jgi:hypothetical protein
MIRFLYYAYVGICSRQPNFAIIKANGLAATAPPTLYWMRSITPVDFPNWNNEIYLTLCSIVGYIGSRFTESESDRPHVIFHRTSSPSTLPFHQSLSYRSPPIAVPQYHRPRLSIPQFHVVRYPDLPGFTKPGSLCCAMVHVLFQPLSNLHPSPHTIPMLDIHSPFVLKISSPLIFAPSKVYSLPYITAPNTLHKKFST